MSLLNTIADKSSGFALANSRSLSKITSTTFAQADTSLPQIQKEANSVAREAIVGSGSSDARLTAPLAAMRDYAVSADPANANSYLNSYTAVNESISTLAENNLPGYTSSLYDIQMKTREALSTGVNSYGVAISSVNPSIAGTATGVGINGLTDAGRAIDAASTTAFSATNNYISNTISGINAKVIDKATAANAAAQTATEDIQELPEITVTTSATTATVTTSAAGIKEGDAASAADNSTDVVYQEVKLYVEGVQVPYESISITNGIGQLPSAMFQIPPQAGLMDIARYYQPKVHIFYTDANTGGDRLLFWGHIIACNFSYSQEGGHATIAFDCIHKNALLQQITFEWSGGGTANAANGGSLTDPNENQATVQLNNFNSEVSLMMALQGISGLQSESKDEISPKNKEVLKADPSKLDARFMDLEKRMVGMPTSIMNLWNQIKRDVYAKESLNVIFSKMFVPLLEDGVRFFDRLSGHVYLENQIQNTKVEHCNDLSRPELSKKTMLPPSFRLDIVSAVQTQMAIKNLKTNLGFSGELTSFYDLFVNFYYGIEYELLTLSSPAEVPIDPGANIDPDDLESWIAAEKMAIETIIKPQIPFYFSPICNVILPNMYSNISVTQQEAEIPTRITAIGTGASQATDNELQMGLNYRAPQSIREAIALGRNVLENGSAATTETAGTLKDTTGSSYNIPGKYELGRGIRNKKIVMPNWLSHYTEEQNAGRAAKGDEQFPIQDSLEYRNLLNLHFAWIDKYGYKDVEVDGEIARARDNTLDKLNPYSTKANIMAYERLLFSAADYEFTREVVKSKSGSLECLFNPYIVAGYPMDIIARSANHPSFHAMCASVTHSITPRSIGTSVSFLAAITYTEMSNYHINPIHPWLRNALSMINVARSETLTQGGDTEQDASDVKAADDAVIKPGGNPLGDLKFGAYRDEAYRKQLQDVKDNQLSLSKGLQPSAEFDTNKGDVESVQQGLIANPRAKAAADMFYRSVFGIGAADPGQMYDFETGQPKAVARMNGNWTDGITDSVHTENGGEGNDNLTGVGSLRLVSRPIEGRKSIEHKFDIRFIDLIPQNYNATAIAFQNEVVTNAKLLEPGASMFLDYEDVTTFLKDVVTEDKPTGE